MGQAKRRGSEQQRIEAAIARERAKFPESVTCNNCGAQLTDIVPQRVDGIPGLRLAGIAHCQTCDHDTAVLDGTPEGLAAAQRAMEHGAGTVVGMGMALKPQ